MVVLGLSCCALYNAHQAGPSVSLVTKDASAAEVAPTPKRTVARGGAVRIDFRAIALREAKAAGIERPQLFVRQMAAESGMNPCAGSPAGAQGIAQIMPSTARSWNNVDPYDPFAALAEAARRMATYERQLGSYELALAAYNAGPGSIKNGAFPQYPETLEYARRVMGDYPLLGLKQVYTRPGGMDPRFKRGLVRLIRAVRARGGSLEVVPGNGFRSVREQSRLWRDAKRKYGSIEAARRWVAPPYCSSHGSGTAADLRGDLDLAHRLGPKYGIKFKIPNEPWHGSLSGY